MFDVTKLTTTVTSTLTDAAETVNERVARITKIDLTQLDLTAFDVTKLEFPKIDLPFELPKVEFPKMELPKVEFPKVELPKMELPKVEFPKVEMPKVDLPAEVDRVADVVRDAAYAGIGAVVIATQMVDGQVRKLVAERS